MSDADLRRHSRYTWMLIAFSALAIFFMAQQSRAETNTLVMQDANFATQYNSGGDFFNNGSAELGMWANSGNKQTVGWANFGASGFSGTARNLQVGDVFTITVAATRAFGQIGFSLNNGGTQGSSYANNISGSRLYVNTDNYGSWYVGGLANSGTSSFSYSPSQDTYKDYQFKVFITSETTGYVELYVNGTYQSTAYNLTLGGSAGENISALSIYGSDMWDGTSNDNAYWKQTSTLVDNGSVNVGYNLGGTSTFNPGVIADGLLANSATSVRTNSVNIGGDSGSIVILDDSSTYGGSTTVNANATARAGNNSAFGTNGVVTVTSGGRIQMSNGVTVGRALVLNGDGLSTSGALQNVNGNNTWSGSITNSSNGRINSDTGTLTISGNISNAASQSLYFGGVGNVTVDGTITGNLTTGNGAVYKDGTGNLTLSGNNSGLSGLLRIKGGTLTITNGNSLGSGSVEFGSGATLVTLRVNSNATIANRFELDNNTTNAVINVASGQTATFTGVLSQTNGMVNTNKFGKDGAGTLVFNNSGGTYNGQIQIGQGDVVLGANNALGTNTSTAQRGVDLGLNVGDVAQANNVSLLASNGVTVGQSIWVEQNTSGATRTIGISGSGTATFTNEVRMNTGTTLTVQTGSSGTDRVNISGPITQNSGAASGVIKQGAGTLALSGANTYTGTTTINAGTLKLERLSGGVGATSVTGSTIAVNSGGTLLLGAANQIGDSTAITLSGGTLDTVGFGDSVGKLTVSGASTIKGLNTTSGTAFTFSDIDLGNYSTSSGSALTFLPTSGTYTLGQVIQLSSVAASSWTGYGDGTSLNNFAQKISFSDASLRAQINFGGGTSGTTLTVAAIPEPKVYAAAAVLTLLIGFAEYRRRRQRA